MRSNAAFFRTWYLKMLSIAVLVILTSSHLLAGGVGTRKGSPEISGNVTDEFGFALEGATVMVLDENGAYLDHNWTNSTGNFSISLPSIPIPQQLTLICMKEGYFQKRSTFQADNGNNDVGTIRLESIPDETEMISGTISYKGGSPVNGANVSLEYHGPQGRYDHRMTTGAGGGYSFDVFPGIWGLRVSLDSIDVHEEHITITTDGGPYIRDISVPELPEKTAKVQGYVTYDSDPVQGAMVAIRDVGMDLGTFSMTDGEGYYEMEFWNGSHTLISLLEGYEAHQTMVELETGTIWYNFTLELEEFWINGTVRDEEGTPLNNMTVQFIKEYNSIHFNTAMSGADGSYSIRVGGGNGYLAAMENDPFETDNYDVFFKELAQIQDDIVQDIVLHDAEENIGRMILDLDDWRAFSVHSSMSLPLNSSKAARAFIDIMLGNCDLVVSEKERERFQTMMLEGEEELSQGPFSDNTGENLTVNGHSFTLVEGTLDVGFYNLTGALNDPGQLELKMISGYTIDGDLLEPPYNVELVFNGSYQKQNEEMEILLSVPDDWIYIESSETIHGISIEKEMITVRPAPDPNEEDGIDHEFVTLFFSNITFEVEVLAPENITEGEEVRLELDIVDHVPDNDRTYSWDIDSEVINTTEPWFDHTFWDNGNYDISVMMKDDLDRVTIGFIQLEITNKDPELEIDLLGGFNRTFDEGDTISFNITGSDVPSDPLMFRWGIMGAWSDNLTLDSINSTVEVSIPDDGNFTFQVRMTDDDGGHAFEEMVIFANNTPPELDVEIKGLNQVGTIDQGKWLEVAPDAEDVEADTISLEWSWPEVSSIETSYNGSNLRIRSLDVGDIPIGLKVFDEDGGVVIWNWTMQVEEDFEFDNDGDGMPRWWEIEHELDDDDAADAGLDKDLDGLTNLEEFQNGTFPGSIDTDGDGMPDDFEIFHYGLNPRIDDADGDLDGDGITNIEEFERGTDPNTPASEDEETDNTILYLLLIMIGLLLSVGAIALVVSRRRESYLDHEE